MTLGQNDDSGDGVLHDSINRRDYLKGAAAAVVATGFSSTAGAADYDTVVVSSNSTENFSVGSGETLENLLIDMTASGASAQITTSGSGWTIRNVGFKGNHPGGNYLIVPGVSSSSGTGLIENVYLGDGQTEHSEKGGIWVNANLPHRGTIIFRNIHVAHMIDNGLYGSGPGARGYGGNAHVEDSYFLSNNISNIRLSSYGAESSVDNCTVEVDGTTRECGVGCSSWGAISNRGVWAWYGNVDIIDSNIQGSLSTSSGGSYTLINTQTGGNADTTPPDCVPMTAVEAASDDHCSGGGTAVQVDEDFSHDDVPGTYDLDTGSFTTTTAQSTSDSVSLQPSASSDGAQVILRDDMEATAGDTYELDVYFQSGSSTDMGFAFGAQGGVTGWSDYTGYLGFFHSDNDEIRIYHLQSGTIQSYQSTSVSVPLDEWLSVELDYRDTSSSDITMTAFDASDSQLGSVTLSDSTYSDGSVGWYNYHAASDWYADSWFNAGATGGPVVVEDFERSSPLDEYGGATSLFSTTSTAYEGSTAITNDGGSFASAVSTSGLSNYPGRGDEVTYYFNNPADDTFASFHLFAQSEVDSPDGYSVGISTAGAWRMWVTDNGNTSQIATESLSGSEQISGWYRAEVWTDSTTVYADLYDDANDTLLASIQANDTTFSSGGIGFRGEGSGETWDYVIQ